MIEIGFTPLFHFLFSLSPNFNYDICGLSLKCQKIINKKNPIARLQKCLYQRKNNQKMSEINDVFIQASTLENGLS